MKNIFSMQPKVSVIVAVYNVAPFLDRCFTSLKVQTLKDFEVIVVDDGSTDVSGQICDTYAREDNRFKVFHKANGGVASAREFGVEKASGAYIIHVDPDDWVDGGMLEALYSCAISERADVVICDFYIDSVSTTIEYSKQKPRDLTHSTILIQYLETSLHGSCWNKLVKRSVWNVLDIHFPPIKLCEDMWVNVKLAMADIRFSYLNKAFYHYVRIDRVGSVTKGGNIQAGINAYEVSVCVRNLLQGTNYWETYVKYSMPWMAYLVLYYDAVSMKEFKLEFKDLLNGANAPWIVRLSLRCYRLGQFLLTIRKMFGRMHRLIGS